MNSHDLFYRMLGVGIGVNCSEPALRALIQVNWGGMACQPSRADVIYVLTKDSRNSSYTIARDGQPTRHTADVGQFLYELEGDLHVALQTCRPELYFVHAAVAEVNGGAYLLVAESGGGKSTTLWGLLHHGWSYISDELAPIDLSSMQVGAYPRALCLKRPPPSDYPLPANTLQTPRAIYVPMKHLPRVAKIKGYPVEAVYFVKYHDTPGDPLIREISTAEAGARLYANALNQLAHTHAGFDAAIAIAKTVPSFALDTADLASTCHLVASHLAVRNCQ